MKRIKNLILFLLITLFSISTIAFAEENKSKLTLSFDDPSILSEDFIEVLLEDSSGGIKVLYLEKVNNYKVTEEVPKGIYKIKSINLSQTKYLLKYDYNLDLSKDLDYQIQISLFNTDKEKDTEEIKSNSSDNTETTAINNTEEIKENKESKQTNNNNSLTTNLKHIFKIAIYVIAAIVILIIIFFIINLRGEWNGKEKQRGNL